MVPPLEVAELLYGKLVPVYYVVVGAQHSVEED